MREAAIHVHSCKITADAAADHARAVPAEVPVAFVYDGSTYAVMMASPSNLQDFAIGFSLTEGIVSGPEEIASLDIVEQDKGIELRMWLAADPGRNLAERRRRMAGPTGCGLCGVESLDVAVRACPSVTAALAVTPADVADALAALSPAQVLHQQTHAVHGAGFWTRSLGLVALAEDVGRHNAIDKLIGRLCREETRISDGIVVLTSRLSVEMVQKAAVVGAPVIVAISAPTGLALETADRAGITVIAVARSDAFEVFTHPHRMCRAPQLSQRAGMVEDAA